MKETEDSIEIQLKKAELKKKEKEIELMDKNSKLDFYIKVLSIVSGIVIGGLGIYSAYKSHLDKLNMKTKLENEISILENDKDVYSKLLEGKKREITEITSDLDSVNNVIEAKQIVSGNQDDKIKDNLNKLTKLTKSLERKNVEYQDLEKKYNARLNDLKNITAQNEALTPKESSISKPKIKINSRRWNQKTNSYQIAITLDIDDISEEEIKSVSYTFPDGSGFYDVDKVDYKKDYTFKVRRDFEIIVILNLRNGKVYTKSKKFPFNNQ